MFKPKLSLSVNCIQALGLKDGVYCYQFSSEYEKTIIQMKEEGFYAVEIVALTGYAWEFEKYVVQACEIAKNHDIRINSIHFPFGVDWINLVSPWENDRQEIIRWLGKIFKRLEKFDIRAYVFHPSDMGKVNESNYQDNIKKLCDTAERLAELTTSYVCVENMAVGYFMFGIKQAMDYIQGTQKAQMVVDVNHFINEDVSKNILQLGDRIKTLHISDNYLNKEAHLMPGEGKLAFMEIIAALEKVGYDGVFNYEILEKYTPRQVKENYEKIFGLYNL